MSLPPVRLPRDEGPHSATTEWWHFMLRLTSAAWNGREKYLVATNLRRRNMFVDELAGILLVSSPPGDFRPHTHLQSFESAFGRTIDPGFTLTYAQDQRMMGVMGRYAIDLRDPVEAHLRTRPKKQAALVGNNGIMSYPGNGELAYAAWTSLEVSGTWQGDQVTGHAWMEHQWGSMLAENYRWKFFAIVLENGEEWLIFEVWEQNGAVRKRHAVLVPAVGPARQFTAQDTIKLETIEPRWRKRYPVRNRITVGNELSVTIEPLFDDQYYQSTFPPFLPSFYEGACIVRGGRAGAPVRGWAITELSGY